MDRPSPTAETGAPRGRDVAGGLVALVSARRLGPGDRLPPEVDLARALGVGRSKLRETLVAWHRMGLVSRNKGAGTVLTASVSGRVAGHPLAVSLVAESLLQTLAVRRPLEVEAVRLAARHAAAADRRRILDRMSGLLADFEAGADWRRADHAFHGAIHEATGNPLFGQLIRQLHQAFASVYEAPFGMPQLGSATIPLHRPLAEAVVAGDAEAGCALMVRILDETEAAARAVAAGGTAP